MHISGHSLGNFECITQLDMYSDGVLPLYFLGTSARTNYTLGGRYVYSYCSIVNYPVLISAQLFICHGPHLKHRYVSGLIRQCPVAETNNLIRPSSSTRHSKIGSTATQARIGPINVSALAVLSKLSVSLANRATTAGRLLSPSVAELVVLSSATTYIFGQANTDRSVAVPEHQFESG